MEQLQIPELEDNQASADERHFGENLWKHIYRTPRGGGFLSLRPWWEAGKLSVDVGALRPGSGVESSTVVWCSAIDLAVYLSAVANDRAARLFPVRAGVDTNESFLAYGGDPAKKVSRVLKIHLWTSRDGIEDRDAFAWKTAHFNGRVTATGAVIPQGEATSFNSIRISRLQMATISYRLDLALSAYAATHPDWLADFNGKRR